MKNIDLLFFPSLFEETFGFVALEALSLGVPVISNINNGVSDLFKKFELDKFLYSNESELINLIKEVLNNNNSLNEFRKEIRQKFKHITTDIHFHEIFNIYKEVLL
jgi:glycosyltransferase involved in cell wall biosynthesis